MIYNFNIINGYFCVTIFVYINVFFNQQKKNGIITRSIIKLFTNVAQKIENKIGKAIIGKMRKRMNNQRHFQLFYKVNKSNQIEQKKT